jgi:hypothetical protein
MRDGRIRASRNGGAIFVAIG